MVRTGAHPSRPPAEPWRNPVDNAGQTMGSSMVPSQDALLGVFSVLIRVCFYLSRHLIELANTCGVQVLHGIRAAIAL